MMIKKKIAIILISTIIILAGVIFFCRSKTKIEEAEKILEEPKKNLKN